MGGRLAPEWVDGINRNGWTASPGIAGRNHAEYAAMVFPEFDDARRTLAEIEKNSNDK